MSPMSDVLGSEASDSDSTTSSTTSTGSSAADGEVSPAASSASSSPPCGNRVGVPFAEQPVAIVGSGSAALHGAPSLASGVVEKAEPWEEHLHTHGPHHRCARCVWMRNRSKWQQALTYSDSRHETGTWLEERDLSHGGAWALGCKICRWAGFTDIWGSTAARGENGRYSKLRRHAASESHRRAENKLLAGGEDIGREMQVLAPDDRHDVPCFALCYIAWKGAVRGSSFTTYTADFDLARDVGAILPSSRRSRMIACQLVTCFGEVLRAQDAALLRQATHVHLTMDARKGNLVVRARLSMRALPVGMVPVKGTEPSFITNDDWSHPEWIRNVCGENVLQVDRLLAFTRLGACSTTLDLSEALVSALQDACCGDGSLWMQVRQKVFAFTPDGAFDEQLSGRLAGGGEDPPFPNLKVVLRCSAHGVQGAIQAGWQSDPLSHELTKSIVQEVAKYVRTSDRFAARMTAKQATEAIAELSNFSFAPQRFSSRDRPLSRMVVFSKAILEALVLEVTSPTSPERKVWAQKILRRLDSCAWVTIAMLADLADDCTRFVRTCDERRSDPVDFWQAYMEFRTFLKREYVGGRMWLRSETYLCRMLGFLRQTQAVLAPGVCSVLRCPKERESKLCQAHVANVAEGILTYLKAEFPPFCIQAKFSAFKLSSGPQPEKLRDLLRLLGWPSERAAACTAQYEAAWPHVVAAGASGLSDTDAWDRSLGAVGPAEELFDACGILRAFLVSETECERSFASERKQFESRPRLSPQMRFAGLKCMVDGVALDHLQREGRPVGRFWHEVQNCYAKKYGTRYLWSVRARKDRHVKRATTGRRGGKETMTSIQRKRAKAVSGLARPAPQNVFGFAPLQAAEMERLREGEKSALFAKLIAGAKKKFDDKRQRYQDVFRGRTKGISYMDSDCKQRLVRVYGQKRAMFAVRCVFGGVRCSWNEMLQRLGGDPWIFAEGGFPPAALERHFGDNALRTYVADSLEEFVDSFVAPRSRIILVKDAASIPSELQMAAALVNALVQTKLLVPLLRYGLRGPLVLAFSGAFTRKARRVVRLARLAAGRPPNELWPVVQVLPVDRFWVAWRGCTTKKAKRQHSLIYASESDQELQNLLPEQLNAVRTFAEFVTCSVSIQGMA